MSVFNLLKDSEMFVIDYTKEREKILLKPKFKKHHR